MSLLVCLLSFIILRYKCSSVSCSKWFELAFKILLLLQNMKKNKKTLSNVSSFYVTKGIHPKQKDSCKMYCCAIERLFTSSITVWFANLTVKEKIALLAAQDNIGCGLKVLEAIYKSGRLTRVLQSINDSTGLPAREMFDLLSSRKQYRSTHYISPC